MLTFLRSKWMKKLLGAFLVLVLAAASGSGILLYNKKDTCKGLTDVWSDVRLLASQGSESVSLLGMYVTSNTLDYVLLEYREMMESEYVFEKDRIETVILAGTKARDMERVETLSEEQKIYIENEENASMCGYLSETSILLNGMRGQESFSETKTYESEFLKYFDENHCLDKVKGKELIEKLKENGTYVDYSALKVQ